MPTAMADVLALQEEDSYVIEDCLLQSTSTLLHTCTFEEPEELFEF